jgi:hypothetical protein
MNVNFKSISLIHKALVGGLLLFSVLTLVLQSSGLGPILEGGLSKVILQGFCLFAFVVMFISRLLINRKLEKLKQSQNDFSFKKKEYFFSLIASWASTEFPGFVAIVAFLLTADFMFLAVGLIVLLLLVLQYPSLEKATLHLNLTPEDVYKMQND